MATKPQKGISPTVAIGTGGLVGLGSAALHAAAHKPIIPKPSVTSGDDSILGKLKKAVSGAHRGFTKKPEPEHQEVGPMAKALGITAKDMEESRQALASHSEKFKHALGEYGSKLKNAAIGAYKAFTESELEEVASIGHAALITGALSTGFAAKKYIR